MPLKIVWRNGIAYACGTVAGQSIRESLGTRERGQAEEQVALLEARLWKRRNYGDEAVRTFEEAADSYLQAGGEARFLEPVILAMAGRVLASIKPEDIRQVARELYPEEGHGATRNRHVLTPAKAVINHAADRGWCHPIRVKPFEVRKAVRRAADSSWLDKFVDQCDGDGLPHLAAAVIFMAQTGARASEACRLTPDNLDLVHRTAHLSKTKTEDWATCHITRELAERLNELSMIDGLPVFGYASRFGLYRRMRAVCRRAGLPWLSPHQAGRHTFATTALADGATVKEVMEGGRWKTAAMVLEIYAHAEDAGRNIADRFDAKSVHRNAKSSKAK